MAIKRKRFLVPVHGILGAPLNSSRHGADQFQWFVKLPIPVYGQNSVNAYQKINSLGSQLHRITVNRSKSKTTSFLTELAEWCPEPISLPDFDRLRTIGFS